MAVNLIIPLSNFSLSVNFEDVKKKLNDQDNERKLLESKVY